MAQFIMHRIAPMNLHSTAIPHK